MNISYVLNPPTWRLCLWRSTAHVARQSQETSGRAQTVIRTLETIFILRRKEVIGNVKHVERKPVRDDVNMQNLTGSPLVRNAHIVPRGMLTTQGTHVSSPPQENGFAAHVAAIKHVNATDDRSGYCLFRFT